MKRILMCLNIICLFAYSMDNNDNSLIHWSERTDLAPEEVLKLLFGNNREPIINNDTNKNNNQTPAQPETKSLDKKSSIQKEEFTHKRDNNTVIIKSLEDIRKEEARKIRNRNRRLRKKRDKEKRKAFEAAAKMVHDVDSDDDFVITDGLDESPHSFASVYTYILQWIND